MGPPSKKYIQYIIYIYIYSSIQYIISDHRTFTDQQLSVITHTGLDTGRTDSHHVLSACVL